ncbi:GMC family oxidoreductase [Piscinibacter sp.]|uniref:GMC family oxidoreductase n=1 Tax=Piscinibacter sp. TaxID=1903157 RepID=UPI002F3F20FA
MKTRRTFIDSLGRFGLAGALAPWLPGCGTVRLAPTPPSEHYDLVVIGSGFGGTMTALWVTYKMNERAGNRPTSTPLRILMLERGTWWTTPTETVQDKQVKTRDFLIARGQPTQEWSSLGDARGMTDLLRRCRYTEQRPQGLYDFLPIGKRGLFNLRNDGVSVLRASGVGGGSLIYSKILLRPPETLFDDPRWPGAWRGASGAALRNRLYHQALRGVTVGVETLVANKTNAPTGLTGPSQILMRSPGITPASIGVAPTSMARADPNRVIWQIRIAPDKIRLTDREGELIDRARVFQTAISSLTPNYGTVDLSINDLDFAPPPGKLSKAEQIGADQHKALRPPGTNYCERHGRCNIGCLPGAGQTLNKQLMRAIYGIVDTRTIDRKVPAGGECQVSAVALQLTPLAQVEHLSEREGGGYLVHYRQRRMDDPTGPADSIVVSADRVIVAGGSLGTTELMLRSRQRAAETGGTEGLRGLSARLGDGFSPNGDHIAFLPETKERINLTYGPVTTSYGQFKAEAPRATGFHQVEDQGVPRALGALTGHGVPVIQKLASGGGVERYVAALGEALKAAQEIFTRTPVRRHPARGPADMSADRGEAEDELTAHIMCVVAQGKDDANGRLRLENDRLRLARADGKPYYKDPIYTDIKETLHQLAVKLRVEGSTATFLSPLSDVKIPFTERTVLTSHPLGGCPMGETVETGVVDDWGRVFRQASAGGGFHRGLYIADGSMLPTALGVNPALTISAVALRVAERVLAEWDQIPAGRGRVPTPLQCGAGQTA